MHGVGVPLAALIVVAAVASTVYWTTYHAYFARLGDDEHRGQQIGAREAIAAVVSVASPLLTGWMLVTFGPRAAFGMTAVIAMAAAVPLLWAPDVEVRRHVPGVFRAALPSVLLFAADGFIGAGNVLGLADRAVRFDWREFYRLRRRDGGSRAGRCGRRHDARPPHRRRAWQARCLVCLGLLALVVALRAAAVGHAALAVLANAMGALGYCLYIPTMMTPIYTMAKRSPCTLRLPCRY